MTNPLGHWYGDRVPDTPEPFLGTPVAGRAARERGAGGLGERAAMRMAVDHPAVLAVLGILAAIGLAVWTLLGGRHRSGTAGGRGGRTSGRVVRLPPV